MAPTEPNNPPTDSPNEQPPETVVPQNTQANSLIHCIKMPNAQSEPPSNSLADQNAVLGKLLLHARTANQADTISVIQTYNVTYDHSRNGTNLKELPRPALDNRAKFFKILQSDSKGKKLFKTRDVLADRIILAIESYFTVTCLSCDKTYSTDLENEPVGTDVLRRFLCYQYAHSTCNSTIAGPPGTTWLCGPCIARNEGPDKKYSPPSAYVRVDDQHVIPSIDSQPLTPIQIPMSPPPVASTLPANQEQLPDQGCTFELDRTSENQQIDPMGSPTVEATYYTELLMCELLKKGTCPLG